MSLLDRLKKASRIELTDTLSKSEIFNHKDVVQTHVPALNIALGGSLDGGLMPGLTMIAGESKHFKSIYALICAKAYLDKYADAVLLFYDSEMGAGTKYFESLDIDPERVLHTPITDIEQLKFDIVAQLEEVKRGDHLIIIVDSVGNLASKKEVEDALNEKSAADMTRAKQLKSLTRLITPHLNLKNIPMVIINHIYMDMGLFPKAITSGGCLEADTQIVMANGSTKSVQHIQVGELVKTKDGDREVINIWNPETLEEGTPECYEIEFEDGYKVVCSAKHKFLINGNWVEAKDLIGGDDVQTV